MKHNRKYILLVNIAVVLWHLASAQNAFENSSLLGEDLRSGTGMLSSNLSGRIPGLLVLQRSAAPGDGATLWIRGVRTSGTDSSPLIFIDGVECDVNLIDMDDVEQVTVLKDASSTALYGVRGANGVILVKTKKGFESKPRVKSSLMTGLVQPINLPQMASTEQWLDYYSSLFTLNGEADPFTVEQKAHYIKGDSPDLYPSVDWISETLTALAMTSKANVNVTGGSERSHYYISGSYSDINGLLNIDKSNSYSPQINSRRFSFRSNVDVGLSSFTKLMLGISSQYKMNNSPITSIGTIMGDALCCSPTAMPVRWSDGSLSQVQEYGTVNPYNDVNSQGYKRVSTLYAQTALTLSHDLSSIALYGLQAKVDFTWAIVNGNTLSRYCNPIYYYLDPDDAYKSDGSLRLHAKNNGSNYLTLSKDVTSTTTITLSPSLLFDRTFEEHTINAAVLFDLRYRTENVPVSYLYSYPYKNMGVGGRIGYSYKNRYAVEVAASYSGSDNFTGKYRFGFYPAASLAWNVSEEDFWENIKPVVSAFKIKGSYGVNGSDQTGSYSRRYVFNNTMDIYASSSTFGTSGQYSPNGITTQYHGYPSLGMEKSVKGDIGTYVSFFKEVNLSAELWSDHRSGIFIADASTPSVAGLTKNYINVGEMRSRGVDLSLAYTHNFSKDYGIDAYATYSYGKSTILADGKPSQAESYMNATGHPYGQQFGLVALGLFGSEDEIASSAKQTFGDVHVGDIRYKDQNEDGVIDYRDVSAIGYSAIPEINYGFGVKVRVRNVDIAVDCMGISHMTRLITGSTIRGGGDNARYLGQIYAEVASERWKGAGSDGRVSYPRMYLNGSPNNSQESTWWQRDMSFFRLKNIEIGYVVRKGVRVFASLSNVFTLSSFTLWDPELATDTGAAYPMTASYVLGLNMNF